MINNENEQKQTQSSDKPDENAKVDVSAYIVIKDPNTGTVLVNKRG
jgi:hypothetical protein